MKVARMLALLILSTSFAVVGMAQSDCVKERVCLSVVSQRWMTKAELRGLSIGLRDNLVRLRLSNNTGNHIEYLIWQDSVAPVGYRLVKRISESEFGASSKAERTPQDLQVKLGTNFRYLRLPPSAAVEFDLPDWGNPREDEEFPEHAFSIFLKTYDGQGKESIVELVSEKFRPLRK